MSSILHRAQFTARELEKAFAKRKFKWK